jgi:putative membrane protein
MMDWDHMMGWWWELPYISYWGVLFWIVQIIIAIFVYKDAQKRKQNDLLWLVLIILPWIGILFLIIYVIIRGEETEMKESIDESLNTLDERYAKGEITREEYFQIQKDLEKMRRER